MSSLLLGFGHLWLDRNITHVFATIFIAAEDVLKKKDFHFMKTNDNSVQHKFSYCKLDTIS